jgi:hypothetical protein
VAPMSLVGRPKAVEPVVCGSRHWAGGARPGHGFEANVVAVVTLYSVVLKDVMFCRLNMLNASAINFRLNRSVNRMLRVMRGSTEKIEGRR